MPADVEFITAVIRAGREYQGRDAAAGGGPGYEFSAMAIIRGGTAEIIGGTGKLTPSIVRDIEHALEKVGISAAHWVRYSQRRSPRAVERVAAENGAHLGEPSA